MFEQDYIMRLIKEMIRAILKLLFHIDSEVSTDLLENEEKTALETLLNMADAGCINEAENQIFEIVDAGDKDSLKMVLRVWQKCF